MSRLLAVSAALALGTPFVATAADITRVASSFEDDDPFGLFVDVGLQSTLQRTKILREVSPGGGARQLLPELQYTNTDTRLNIDVAAGISRDVEFSIGLPVVLLRNEYLERSAEARAGTLTSESLFTVPTKAYRFGLGNLRFGLAWAIFNQKKDDTKPTWVARLDYEAPTAGVLDPTEESELLKRTLVGDRVHKYTLSTALSRRIGVTEPYFKMFWTIPVQGPGVYNNCQHSDLLAQGSNCGSADWPTSETGIQSPTIVGVVFGSEFEVFRSTHQKFVLDVRFMNNYVGEGRYYNELSAGLKKLLATSDYLQMGGRLALTGQIYDFLTLRGSATFLYNTDHALTDEKEGRDTNGDGQPDVTGNPNYDPRYDSVSHRFYASQSKDIRLDVTATFSF